ncbi:hypothetical protein [Candidatus Leptofilum sp.]|uniref:hypothetical protein n=1 Tax=Candidatus Leptofilum sp. TaxID=3241576 RepID=UPI003B5CCB9C
MPAHDQVTITRPVVVTELPTQAVTAVPHTPTPIATATKTATAVTTAQPTPFPTSTPEPTWPTTPVLFVRDGALQRWLPKTNEIELLVEGVNFNLRYHGEFATFLRETEDNHVYEFVLHHVPTQTEIIATQIAAQELFTEAGPIYSIPFGTVSVSPMGEWVVFISEAPDSNYLTLSINKLTIENSIINLQPAFNVATDVQREFAIRFSLSWENENQLFWLASSGIWGLNLIDSLPKPEFLIQPSTNTYEHPGVVDANGNYLPVTKAIIPSIWSPDGRYLIAREEGFEGGTFLIIERETNRTSIIPDASYGAYSDALIWITNDSFLHFNLSGKITHWQVQAEDPFALAEIKSFQFEHGFFDNLSQISDNHIRFSYSLLAGPATSWIYDLNFETGEFSKLSSDLESREIVVYWTSKNEEILWQPISGSSSSIFYDSLDGQTSVNLDVVFGTGSCCWYWERADSE